MQEILPDFILADLYPHSIVVLENAQDTQKSSNKAPAIKPPSASESAASTASNAHTSTISAPRKPAAEVVAPIVPPVAAISSVKPQQWYLGDNGKNIVILVKEQNAVHLNDDHLQFLSKILGACKLNMGDVAVINIAHQSASFSTIKQELRPAVCIFFEVTAETVELPFVVPDYQIQQYDGCQFLMAPALTVYLGESSEAKTEKTKLWNSLKKIFNL